MSYIFVLNEDKIIENTKFYDDPSTLLNQVGCKIKTHYYDSIEFYGTAFYDNNINKAIVNNVETDFISVLNEIKTLLPQYISLISSLNDNEINYKDEDFTVSWLEQFTNYSFLKFDIVNSITPILYNKADFLTLYNKLILLISAIQYCNDPVGVPCFKETMSNLELFLKYSLHMVIYDDLLKNEGEECSCPRKFCSCEEQYSEIKEIIERGNRFFQHTIPLLTKSS